MKIHGAEGMTTLVIHDQLNLGGRFVQYEYCYSLLIRTVRRKSDIYFIKWDEPHMFRSLPLSLITILFGWWGIPRGPVQTIETLITNFGGGKNVTKQVLAEVYSK
jgi:hypothetical protein